MSIQIDNGDFTRIHNDILDGLAQAHLTALEFRCVVFLVRMTYGWQKKEDKISLSQWAAGLGLDDKNRGNILNTLNGLVAKGVIYTRSNGNNRPATWGLIKSYFEKPTVMQPHNSCNEEPEPTVMPEHNTTVMQPHNTSVMPEHNSSAKTVMQPHNHQRNSLKKELKKVKETPRARARSGDAHPGTQPIMDAYIVALGYKPTNYGKESSAAKKLAQEGYAPADVVAAYQLLKSEAFWRAKHLSLQTILEQIPALQSAHLKGVPMARSPSNGNGYTSKGARQEEEVDRAFRLLETRGVGQ